MAAKSERFEMRLDSELLGRIDDWRLNQTDNLSRAEAVRVLVERSLPAEGYAPVAVSSGEKIIIGLLGSIMTEGFENTDWDYDPDFIRAALSRGQSWSIRTNYPYLVGDFDADPKVVEETANILTMWRLLEQSFEKLTKKEKASITGANGEPVGELNFPGFDGNEEGEYLSVVEQFVDKLDRFSELKGRYLNSHSANLDDYRDMLPEFETVMRECRSLKDYRMTKEQIQRVIGKSWASRL